MTMKQAKGAGAEIAEKENVETEGKDLSELCLRGLMILFCYEIAAMGCWTTHGNYSDDDNNNGYDNDADVESLAPVKMTT